MSNERTKVLVAAGTVAAVEKANAKRGALPITAKVGDEVDVTIERLQEMARVGNFKGLKVLRIISDDNQIYKRYVCTVAATDLKKSIKITFPDRDPFYLPRWEVVEEMQGKLEFQYELEDDPKILPLNMVDDKK